MRRMLGIASYPFAILVDKAVRMIPDLAASVIALAESDSCRLLSRLLEKCLPLLFG
jgi:hypothetical protein